MAQLTAVSSPVVQKAHTVESEGESLRCVVRSLRTTRCNISE